MFCTRAESALIVGAWRGLGMFPVRPREEPVSHQSPAARRQSVTDRRQMQAFHPSARRGPPMPQRVQSRRARPRRDLTESAPNRITEMI